jgi:hypothetical protein
MPSTKELTVKYVVLIFNNPATWEALPETDRDRVMDAHNSGIRELRATGELLRVDGLADPAAARTIRARGGVPVVTDGPFGESKEYLAGVWALDVDSLERAIEIAMPLAEFDTVEVRQLMDLGGLEM